MCRKLQFKSCKYSTYIYTLILNYMDKPQLQHLSRINHMQNIWFLKGYMEKYIQFLKL